MAFEVVKRSPFAFKVLIASALIENVGFGLIIPYLTIYMVQDLEISTPLAGIALAGYTLSGIPAMIIGGMLADKLGRRKVLVASLGLMSITMSLYFFATGFWSLLVIILADSFVGSLYMPAAQAMIADVIAPADRPAAFSTIRISWNLGMFVGPAIGAVIVASMSIRELFLFGAVILAGAFVMNVIYIPETRPVTVDSEEITFRSTMRVGRNRPFLVLVLLTGALWFFMSQWMSVLQLYVTETLKMSESIPGVLFALNAVLVVTLQLWVTSKMVAYRRSLVLLSGQLVAAAGFTVLFLVNDLTTLICAIIVMTLGEIIYMSIVSTVIADMAPEKERGMYMGFAGFIQSIAMGVAFFFGMWLLDFLQNDKDIWLIFGAIGFVTSIGYLAFAKMIGPEKDNPSKYGHADAKPTADPLH